MRLIWYNRDEFSDQDMIRAKAVSNKLLSKPSEITMFEIDFSFWDSSKRLLTIPKIQPFGWEPAPQWAKEAKLDDRKREEL